MSQHCSLPVGAAPPAPGRGAGVVAPGVGRHGCHGYMTSPPRAPLSAPGAEEVTPRLGWCSPSVTHQAAQDQNPQQTSIALEFQNQYMYTSLIHQ